MLCNSILPTAMMARVATQSATMVGLIAVLAMPAIAAPTRVDFSGHVAATQIGSTYQGLGLTFSSGPVFAQCLPGGCPASDVGGYFATAYGAGFTAFFSAAQSSISFQTASFNTANGFASSTFAQAYDSMNNLVGTGVTANPYGADNTIYTLSGANIAKVVFSYGGGTNGPAITDLTFDAPDAGPAAVPEPASWAMMIGGFSLVGGALRRRRAPTLAMARA